jgi:hypothetical protein
MKILTKRLGSLLIVFCLLLTLLPMGAVALPSGGIIAEIFPDVGLAEAVATALGLEMNDVVTQGDLESIETLHAWSQGISDLAGIQHLTALRHLYLQHNAISDITPIVALLNGIRDQHTGSGRQIAINLDHNAIRTLAPLKPLLSQSAATNALLHVSALYVQEQRIYLDPIPFADPLEVPNVVRNPDDRYVETVSGLEFSPANVFYDEPYFVWEGIPHEWVPATISRVSYTFSHFFPFEAFVPGANILFHFGGTVYQPLFAAPENDGENGGTAPGNGNDSENGNENDNGNESPNGDDETGGENRPQNGSGETDSENETQNRDNETRNGNETNGETDETDNGNGGENDTPWTPGQPLVFATDFQAYLIGDVQGNIRPNDVITRAEVASILFRLKDDDHREAYWSQTNDFPDVSRRDWFNNAVSTLTQAGMFQGRSDGGFAPNAPMTRGEFAAVMSRASGALDTEGGTYLFPDIYDHWAAQYIIGLAQVGWIQGIDEDTFEPDRLATRAEVAAIVHRVIGWYAYHIDCLHPDMLTWPDNDNPEAWYFIYIQTATNSYYREVPEGGGCSNGWEQIVPPRAWYVLERPDARPGDIHRPDDIFR